MSKMEYIRQVDIAISMVVFIVVRVRWYLHTHKPRKHVPERRTHRDWRDRL